MHFWCTISYLFFLFINYDEKYYQIARRSFFFFNFFFNIPIVIIDFAPLACISPGTKQAVIHRYLLIYQPY